jgi:arginase family enzyme
VGLQRIARPLGRPCDPSPKVIDRFVFLRSSRSALQIVKFATDSAEDLQGERFTNWSTITRIVEDEKVHPRKHGAGGTRGAINPSEQFQWLKEQGVGVYTMREVIRRGIEDVITEALERVRNDTHGLYVSWDLDSIDASAAPGTNGPEPGGLTPRETLRAAEMIGGAAPDVFDVSEYLPSADTDGITGRIACYLYFHVLGGLATKGELPQR